MGTASTMTSLAEVLGFSLPGASSIPAPDSRHSHMASASGRRIVEMIWEDYKPSRIVTRSSFNNAIVTLMALGGSTNAVIHLLALAKRAKISLTLDDFQTISKQVPVICNLKPSGQYLMEDFFDAGGLRALLNRLGDLLDTTQLTVTGRTLSAEISAIASSKDDVIRQLDNPLIKKGGLSVLRGNLAPDGAIIKTSASSAHLLRHRGRAVVFDSYADFIGQIDDPALDITADDIIVVRNIGPKGVPGMPEWGMVPLPKKLLEAGIRDMIRISDARMSGTAFGTVVLHVAPEAAVGGPLALAETGDFIELDAEAGRLHLDVSEAELARRKANWVPPRMKAERGWPALYAAHVSQANEGCDLDFLAASGDMPEPEIYG